MRRGLDHAHHPHHFKSACYGPATYMKVQAHNSKKKKHHFRTPIIVNLTDILEHFNCDNMTSLLCHINSSFSALNIILQYNICRKKDNNIISYISLIIHTHLVADACFSSMLKQKPNHHDISLPGGHVQWCVPILNSKR